MARKTIRNAENNWFQGKAEEAEKEHFGGKKVYKCIRDMQHGHRGLRPSRVVSIEDENGVLCTTTNAQHQRWGRHFKNMLNIRTGVMAEEMERVCQREVRADLGNIP